MRRFSKIGKSFAVLFVDARNAFYSLLLEQVLGAADQESALNKVLEKISELFPDVMAPAAKRRAVERHELGTALQAAGLGDHFIRVLVNWHHRSWISVEGVRNIACCSKGTRPGDPLADNFQFGNDVHLVRVGQMQGGTAVCSMGANGRSFFWESGKLRYGFVSGGELR